MKPIFPLLLVLTGCSSMISTTKREPVFPIYATAGAGTNSGPIAYKETTHIRIRTFFDAQAQVAKTGNRSGYTTNGVWGPGTYATGVNEASSSTNLVDIIGAVARGVVSGLKP